MNRMIMCAPLLGLLLSCAGCGGVGFVYKQKLTGKYGLIAVDTQMQMSLCEILPSGSGVGVVSETVFAVGWNSEFIIVKRHPSDGFQTIDRSVTEFYILEVNSGKLDGPLDELSFQNHRSAAGVPDDLSFSLTFADLQ